MCSIPLPNSIRSFVALPLQFPLECLGDLDRYICPSSIVIQGYDPSRCSDGFNYNPACIGGFFDDAFNSSEPEGGSMQGNLVPCCPGFFCSRTTACMQPCSTGAFCSIGTFQNSSGICFPSRTSYIDENHEITCGGAGADAPCPAGYYCPTTTSIEECPSAHYCPVGSTATTECTSFFGQGSLDNCPAGGSYDQIRGMAIFFCFIPIFLFLGMGCLLQNFTSAFKTKCAVAPAFVTNANNMEIQSLHLEDVRVWRDDKLGFFLNVDNENIDIATGVTAIVGLSGVGKSTLFDTLSGSMKYYHAVKATVRLPGSTGLMDYAKFYQQHGHRIAYVVQHEIMHTPLTVFETILYSALLRTNFTYDQCAGLTAFWIEKIGLKKAQHDLTSKLSGGMRKRVNVAMELVTDPLILILDEPTSGLDTLTTESLLNILKEFAEGSTSDISTASPRPGRHTKRIVVAVLHQPSYEVAKMFTRILGVKSHNEPGGEKGKGVGGVDFPLKEFLAPAGPQIVPNPKAVYLDKMIYHADDQRNNPVDSYVLTLGRYEPSASQLTTLRNRLKEPRTGGVACCHCIPRYSTVQENYYWTFLWHYYVSVRRALSLFLHNWPDFVTIVILAVFLGFALGFFNKNLSVEKVPPAAFLLVLATSLICLQTGIKMRLSNQPASLREDARGVHTIAIYLGECTVEMIWIFAAPGLILLLFMAYAVPRAPFYMYYWILWAVAFSASGAGHALAEIVPTAGTVGIYLNLALALLCGFSPTKTELPNHLTDFSFLSFTFEALVNGEYHYYPAVTQVAAQYVLHSTLKVESCTFYSSVSIYTPDAPLVVDSCPLDCDFKCVNKLITYCVLWGLAFRLIVVVFQFWKYVGFWYRLQSCLMALSWWCCCCGGLWYYCYTAVYKCICGAARAPADDGSSVSEGELPMSPRRSPTPSPRPGPRPGPSLSQMESQRQDSQDSQESQARSLSGGNPEFTKSGLWS